MAAPILLRQDTDQGSSLWWIKRLTKELDARAVQLRRLDSYYDGDHNLKYATEKFRKAFGDLFNGLSDNFCRLVVDALRERLTIQGFRMGGDEDPEADKDAWRIWQANQLDAESMLAHTEGFVKGLCYIHVSAYSNDWIDDRTPSICIEDALEVYVELDALGRKRRAAIKRWVDDSGLIFINLYLPDRLEKWQSETKVSDGTDSIIGNNTQWVQRLVDGEEWPLPNPLADDGVIPFVPLVNRSRLRKRSGGSEIQDIIPLQDGLNKLIADLMLASEYASFRQRYAINFDPDEDPDTGKPIEPFHAGVDRVWTAGAPEDGGPPTQFGEFGETNLANIVTAVEMVVQHIASLSHVPPHYLNGLSGQFPSGDALTAVEAGLVAKAREKMVVYGEAWEEALRLAFTVMGDARGDVVDGETIWGDPEHRTEAQHLDALAKMAALGVPLEALWPRMGFTPSEIERFKAMRANEPTQPALKLKTLTENAPADQPPGVTPGLENAAAAAVAADNATP